MNIAFRNKIIYNYSGGFIIKKSGIRILIMIALLVTISLSVNSETLFEGHGSNMFQMETKMNVLTVAIAPTVDKEVSAIYIADIKDLMVRDKSIVVNIYNLPAKTGLFKKRRTLLNAGFLEQIKNKNYNYYLNNCNHTI